MSGHHAWKSMPWGVMDGPMDGLCLFFNTIYCSSASSVRARTLYAQELSTRMPYPSEPLLEPWGHWSHGSTGTRGTVIGALGPVAGALNTHYSNTRHAGDSCTHESNNVSIDLDFISRRLFGTSVGGTRLNGNLRGGEILLC